VTGVVDLLEVVLLGPGRVPDLREQRLGEVKELALFKVGRHVGLVGVEVFIGRPVCVLVRVQQLYDRQHGTGGVAARVKAACAMLPAAEAKV
jgi:hypothetical protein